MLKRQVNTQHSNATCYMWDRSCAGQKKVCIPEGFWTDEGRKKVFENLSVYSTKWAHGENIMIIIIRWLQLGQY